MIDTKEYLEEMKKIQENLLEYLEKESNVEENYQNLIRIFDDKKIHNNQYKIKSLMHLILQISKNHYRGEGFFSKIEQIISIFADDLKKYFSNSEIFNIFKRNKRILLFLIESKILIFDEFVVKSIIQYKYTEAKYPHYFQPEIEPFMKEQWFPKMNESYDDRYWSIFKYWVKEIQQKIPDDFYEKRKIGENDDVICEMIRKDSIEDFIIYVNKKDVSLNLKIDLSIYETNPFLIKKNKITLIEYASFFGAIQIFNYLYKNNVQLTRSLWYFAIHGRNAEIISILEENYVGLLLYNEFNEEILKESIKCHHIDVTNYILNNYFTSKESNPKNEMINSLRYYNFIFIQQNKIDETVFGYLCEKDYYIPVFNLLSTKSININKKSIYKN